MSSSSEWINRADKHVMKTYGRYPIVAERGEGCRLWDVDGKVYLDFLAGGKNDLDLIIADVSGHDVSSGAVSASLR